MISRSETPEQQRAAIALAIGQCITTWAAVERALTLLYTDCVGCGVGTPEFTSHAAIFNSVISIDARLDMIEAALRTRRTGFLNSWKTLRDKVGKRYKKRNEVAHSDIAQTGMQDGSQLVRLLVFPTLTTGVHGGPTKLLRLAELRDRRKSFERLSNEVISFRDQVRAAPAPPPKSP